MLYKEYTKWVNVHFLCLICGLFCPKCCFEISRDSLKLIRNSTPLRGKIFWQASSSKYLYKSKWCDFVLSEQTVLWMWPEAGPCTVMGGTPRCWGWVGGAGKKCCAFTVNEALWVTEERLFLNWWVQRQLPRSSLPHGDTENAKDLLPSLEQSTERHWIG